MWLDRLELVTVLVLVRGPIGGVARAALSRVARPPEQVTAVEAPQAADAAAMSRDAEPELAAGSR